MALQTSISEYFGARKRGAPVDDLKKAAPSNKVLILDKNSVTGLGKLGQAPDVDTPVRAVIYAESPPASTSSTSSAPKRTRKTPSVSSRRSSASKEKQNPGQPDIRKCLFPLKSSKTKLPTSKLSEETSPLIEDSKLLKELESLPVAPALTQLTPKKEPKSEEGSQEEPCTPKKEFSKDNLRSESLRKSNKLADLKNRLKHFHDGFNKLKEIQERKEKIPPVSPKIKEFKTIEVEVNVSPKKKTDVIEEVKTASSPSLLRKALFMSPSKLPPGAAPYVSPRKLFENPPEALPTKPAYQRHYDLAATGKPALPLPYKYRCLAETFRSVDTVVSMMYNRNENVVFNKLKSSVQQLSKRNLTESHIGQIMSVLPKAFELKREKVRTLGNQKEQYELILLPVIPEDSSNSGNNKGEKERPSMSPSVLLQRRRDFYSSLLETVKTEHELFLRSLDPPMEIPRDELMRWHPDFDVDSSCKEIPSAPLPSPPVNEKLSTAKDVLSKVKDMLSTNNRMERVLERMSNKEPPPKSETAAATAALSKALKGIPKSLLERVRAKQAAKTAALMTRCPEETKRRLELTRLPELARILRNIFVLERKNVISQPVVVEKVAMSFREVLPQDDMARHFRLISESVPGWLTEITDGDKKYLRLARDADFTRVTKRLQQLIDENQVNL